MSHVQDLIPMDVSMSFLAGSSHTPQLLDLVVNDTSVCRDDHTPEKYSN